MFIELHEKVGSAPHRGLESLAIIGMACRFPGEAENIDAFWRLLACGKMTVSEVPKERWDWRRYYSADPDSPGRAYVRHGNFLRQDIRRFDAGFFGISPREAEVMDPQQRLLLEMAWETIEHAGVDLAHLNALRTGVYVGAFTLDNLIGRMSGQSRFLAGAHTAVGSTATILSNRISHAFDLTGPSLSVDTACSSSLVAFHLACQALWQGDCQVALVGGVNVMLRPEYLIAMSKGHFLARDGRSKTFDAAGDGYGRGEGAGMVMLKPLARAQADGDRVLALVRATGCNQDGRTEGITVPSGAAQRELMATVLDRAGLAARDIHYVEAHGTGTALGDPIETSAIGAVLGKGRDMPLPVGSVKANIGHLEAASGMAGLIKLVLCMRERQLPPVAGLTTLHPGIDFAGLNLHPSREVLDLPAGDLRMAINSFGYGGTNAHVILASAPTPPAVSRQADQASWGILPISARSEAALVQLVQDWEERLVDSTKDLHSLLASAALRRSHHDYRIAFAGASCAELRHEIGLWLRAKPRAERPLRDRRIVFVYTGMGPQWWGMARGLLTTHPASQAIAAEFDGHFRAITGWSLVAELLRPEAESRVSETVIAQTGNLLCQILVTCWLREHGIQPAAMLGHSVGEVAVAWASGVLSLEAAVRVGTKRASLQAQTAGQGGMLAIGMAEVDVRALIEPFGGKIEIAAVNGPTAVTLAGDNAALGDLAGRLEVRGIFNRRLRVEVAYHSRYMDPILEPLRESLADLSPAAPVIPTWSTVSGAREVSDRLFNAEYWCRNVREPVRFRAAIEEMYQQGYRLFLEIGPHSVLGGNIRESAAPLGGEVRALSTLARNASDFVQLYGTLGRLYAAGVAPDWRQLNGEPDAQIDLPAHPWLRETLWSEAESDTYERLGPPPGPLCGGRFDHPTPTWERPINSHYLPWVVDHVVDGLVLLPGAAFIDTLLAVAQQVLPDEGALCIREMTIQRPLVLDRDNTLLYRSSYDVVDRQVVIASRDETGGLWTQHAQAHIGRVARMESRLPDLPDTPNALDVTALYERFERMGLSYGPAFRRIRKIDVGATDVRAELSALSETPTDIEHQVHPAVLDAAFHAMLAIVAGGSDVPWVPTGIEAITLLRKIEGDLVCIGHLRSRSAREVIGDLWLIDAAGHVVMQIEGLRCIPVGQKRDALSGLLYREQFESLLPAGEPTRLGDWLLLCEDGCMPGCVGEYLARGMAGVARALPYAIGEQVGPLAQQTLTDAITLSRLVDEYPALAGVVYLAAPGDTSPEQARARVVHVQTLIQSLARRTVAPRVYLVTQDAQAVLPGDRVAGHAQAAIHGYGRVAHNECPDLGVTLIDCDDATASRPVLLAELLADDIEDDVALRAGQRMGRRIRPLDPKQMQTESLAARTTTPRAVELAMGLSEHCYWREVDAPRPVPGQALLAIHRLSREESGETPLCGFLAQVEAGVPGLPTGAWLAGAARMRPASHLLADPETLVFTLIAHPQAGMERLASLWAGLHAAFSRVLPRTGTGALLLFGADRPEAGVVQALAPLFGIEQVILADDYQPGMRGLAARLVPVLEGRPLVAALFVDVAGATPQSLPLMPAAQIICLGAARDMEIAPWLRGVVEPGAHRLDPSALFQAAPERIRFSLAVLAQALARSVFTLPKRLDHTALEWVEAQAPTGQCVAMTPLPAALPIGAFGFDASGTWLITGGFGGFGLACAEWLVEQGVRDLILVGRSGAGAEANARLARLEQAGVRLRTVRADISDRQAVHALCAEVADGAEPLAGVVHAAGVLADRTLQEMSEDELQRALIPKIDGAWHLSEALEASGSAPRHVLFFSSIAASVGNTRQANYAAANVALDALAAWRRARGLPADCVAWGALGFGMGVSNDVLARHFEAMGLQPLNVRQTMIGLHRVLAERPGTVILAGVDWVRLGQFDPVLGRSPKVVHLTGKTDATGDATLKRELASMDAEERVEVAVCMLAEALSGPLKMAPERIDAERALSDLGVDSLMAVEIQFAIAATFGVEFSTLELMRSNTVRSLAVLVLDRMNIHSLQDDPQVVTLLDATKVVL